MTARQLIDRLFGVRTRAVENPVLASVGTTATEILRNDPSRLAWIIINLSTNTLYISLGRDVSSTKSILLQANGGSAQMAIDEDFDMVTYAVWGVASGAASAIYSLAVVEY